MPTSNALFVLAFVAALSSTTAATRRPPEPVAYPDGFRRWSHVHSALVGPGGTRPGLYHIYANDAAMRGYASGRFPEGSIIVKEKFHSPEDRKPLLYTIMRKREAGYNPKVGDWEFSVVGPNGTEMQAIGKLENCQGCHLSKSESDFVFRPYVTSQ